VLRRQEGSGLFIMRGFHIIAISCLVVLSLQDTLFEGDILVRGDTSSREDLLALLHDPSFLWPRGEVFYAFDALSEFTAAERGLVVATMRAIEDKTGCVQFREVSASGVVDLVLITARPGNGCWSHFGRQGGTQALILGHKSCFNPQMVTHQLLHTLGASHESSEHGQRVANKTQMVKPNLTTPNIMENSSTLTAYDSVKVVLSYNCSLKPDTLVNFVYDNVNTLQKTDMKYQQVIEEQATKIATLSRQLDSIEKSDPWVAVFSSPSPMLLQRGRQLARLAVLGKQWKVSHDFLASSYSLPGISSSVHLTVEGGGEAYGDSVPAIFFHPHHGMLVISAVNGQHNFHANVTQHRPNLGQWTSIEISQELVSGEFWLKISIGGREVFAVNNQLPTEFSSVKVFASDPWHLAQPGSIRNLTIQTKGLNAMHIMKERQSKKIKELKKEVNAVRLKGLEVSEKLQRDHFVDIEALKEELAKVLNLCRRWRDDFQRHC